MRRLFIILGVVVVIVASILTMQYLSPSTGYPWSSGSSTLPLELPTTLKPSQGLVEAIARTKGHIIGLVANSNSAIGIVDLTSKTLLGNLTIPNPTHSATWGIDFTPDGSTLLLSTPKEVLFLTLETLNITKRISLGQSIETLLVNPRRNEAYVFGNGDGGDPNLYILNLQTLQIIKKQLPDAYYYSALSPDYNTLYVSSRKQILFIDAGNHTVRSQINVGSGYFDRIKLSPDGSRIYVSYLKDDDPMTFAAIREYDVSSGKLLRAFENVTEHVGNVGPMRGFVVSPDGRRICIQEQSDKMIILNLDSGNVTYISYEGGDQEFWGASDMVFSPDGSEIYLTYAGAIPIDSPGPTTPSLIGIYETTHFSRVGTLSLREGCYKMVLAPH